MREQAHWEEGPSGPSSRYPLASGPLPFGQIMDCGIRSYHEFACSRGTYSWLASGAMRSVDGVPVTLQVVDTCAGGHNVIVKAWPQEPA